MPFVAINTMSNRITRNLLASKPGQAQLTLTYENITDAQGSDFVLFYETCKGGNTSFVLPVELLSGLGSACADYIKAVGSSLTWRWEQPPRLDFVKKGICTVSVTLKAYVAPGTITIPSAAPVIPYNPVVARDNTIYPSFSGIGVIPPTPPTPVPGIKWIAYSTINETAINTHDIVLADDGSTYAFIANQAYSELVKFSSVGAALWTQRFASISGQLEWGPFGLPAVKISQAITRISDTSFICSITEQASNSSNPYRYAIFNLDQNGDVRYGIGYANSQVSEVNAVSNDGRSFLAINTPGYSTGSPVNVFRVSDGEQTKRFTFTNITNVGVAFIRNVIQKPNGNWVFYVTYGLIKKCLIETDSSFQAVIRSTCFPDLDLTSSFCYRPDTGGYLFLGGDCIYYLSDSLQLIETRRFLGTASHIQYDSNGDYYIWASYTNWYQDIGIPGWPNLITLIKYNWNSDYVHYVTSTNGNRSPTSSLNNTLRRMSFAQEGVGRSGGGSYPLSYRMVHSFDLIQPSSTNNSPLNTSNPPNFSFLSRTIAAPTLRPTMETRISSREQASVSIFDLPILSKVSHTFEVQSIYRDYTTAVYP